MANEIISLQNLARFKSKYDTFVQGLINSAIAGVYKVKGSKTVGELNQMTISALQNGDVYNVTTSGTLTAGNVQVVAGDNVVWVITNGTGAWDKFAGLVDLSGYLPKSAGSSNALTGYLYFVDSNHFIAVENDFLFIANQYNSVISFLGVDDNAVHFDFSALSGDKTLTIRNVSGTIALTSDLSAQNIATYLGYTPYDGSTNPNGYITGITSTMITNALGYTPYSASNPNGYISGITSSMVTTALGYTPLSTSNFATDSDIDALFS